MSTPAGILHDIVCVSLVIATITVVELASSPVVLVAGVVGSVIAICIVGILLVLSSCILAALVDPLVSSVAALPVATVPGTPISRAPYNLFLALLLLRGPGPASVVLVD